MRDFLTGGNMPGQMILRVWDVEHGACAMLTHHLNGHDGRLAMIDSGSKSDWTPGKHIKHALNRTTLDYLMITNADQDHMSGLENLWEEGLSITAFSRNRNITAEQMTEIKKQSGPLTRDAQRYIKSMGEYIHPVTHEFNDSMGGITRSTFSNSFPKFRDTNNLSQAIFIKFGPFKMLFPGDLEKSGWQELLNNDKFKEELKGTTILEASHHGRESGFCEEIFDYFNPMAVVISDKPIVHDTQRTVPDYRNVVHENGVLVKTTGKRRHVLTTRRDGWIQFTVEDNGHFTIDTECHG